MYLPPRPPADPKGVPYCRRRRPRRPLPPFNPEIFFSSSAGENAPQAKIFAIYCRRDPPPTLTPLSYETVLPPPRTPADPYPLPSESIRRRRDPPPTLKGLLKSVGGVIFFVDVNFLKVFLTLITYR